MNLFIIITITSNEANNTDRLKSDNFIFVLYDLFIFLIMVLVIMIIFLIFKLLFLMITDRNFDLLDTTFAESKIEFL